MRSAFLIARNTVIAKTERVCAFQSLQPHHGWVGGGRLTECRQLEGGNYTEIHGDSITTV